MGLPKWFVRTAVPLLLCGACLFASSDMEKMVRVNRSASFSSRADLAKPLVELPDTVKAEEGKITLWADFDARGPDGIALYLVNNTNQQTSFSAQDYDLHIKLEYQSANGSWKRAQAHMFSWCGVSYFSVVLPARQFFKLTGYAPAGGEMKKVRYTGYGDADLVSNTGQGLVWEEDVTASSLDALTASEIPLPIRVPLDNFARSGLSEGRELNVIISAIRSLVAFRRNEVAIRTLGKMKEKALLLPESQEKTELISTLDETLRHKWPDQPDKENFLHKCVNQLSKPDQNSGSISENFAWQIVGAALDGECPDLMKGDMLVPQTWQQVVPAAVTQVRLAGGRASNRGAASVLRTGWIVDSFVEDRELESWLFSSSPALLELGANGLARRSRHARLSELAFKLPAAEKIKVLVALAYPYQASSGMEDRKNVRSPERRSAESGFWLHCASTMPVETSHALRSWKSRGGEALLDRLVHDSLREFWIREAKNSREQHDVTTSGQRLKVALDVFAAWKLPEDDAVLQDLLHSGAYVRQEFMIRGPTTRGEPDIKSVTRTYILRRAARNALVERGKPEPSGIVYDEPLSD